MRDKGVETGNKGKYKNALWSWPLLWENGAMIERIK